MTRTPIQWIATAAVVLAVTGGAMITAQQRTPSSAQSAEVLMGAALHQEEVEGNLEAAIATYNKVIADRRAGRAVLATALVRLGRCYEKLGNAEARKVYERVLLEYADQTQAVTVARTQLAALGAGAARSQGALTRVAWSAPAEADIHGKVSPDGRYIPYRGLNDTGDLYLHDLETGASRRLTQGGPFRSVDEVEYPEGSAFSRDGKQLAYAWRVRAKGRYQLRVISLEGTGIPQSRVLLDNEDVAWAAPYDWTPDGKWIAVVLQRKNQTAQIGLISTEDGRLRPLKSVEWRGAPNLALSPDGAYLAFDLRAANAGTRDVFVLDIGGAHEVAAVADRTDEALMGWSPDGKQLLFVSDRTGNTALWALPFAAGAPQGEPALIKGDIGQFWPMGVTRSGALYGAAFSPVGARLKLASFDFATGQFRSAPTVLDDFVGPGNVIRWSHDGKLLAHASQWIGLRPLTPRFNELMTLRLKIRAPESGEVRELRPRLQYINTYAWADDDRSLFAAGADLQGRTGVYRVDARSGETGLVVRVEPNEQTELLKTSTQQSQKLYYLRIRIAGQTAKLVEHDLVSNDERDLFPYGPRTERVFLGIADNRVIVFVNDASAKSTALMSFPVSGGTPVELMRTTEPDVLVSCGWPPSPPIAWAPDGKSGLVMKATSSSRSAETCVGPGEMWRVWLDGRQPEKLGERPKALWDSTILTWADDGKSVFFIRGGANARKSELWRVWLDGTSNKVDDGLDLIQGDRGHSTAATPGGDDRRYVAYNVRDNRPATPLQVWVVENFLPSARTRQ